VYVSAENGLFRSVDGIHWESFDSTAGMTIYDAVKDTFGRIWIGTPLGLQIYIDNELAWTLMATGGSPRIISIVTPDTLIRPTSGYILDSVVVMVLDPDSISDVQSVWFQAHRPNGTSFKFFLINQGNGRFSLTYRLDSTGILGTHTWVFFAEDRAGNVSDSVVHFITIIDTTISSVSDRLTIPGSFALLQNFPNPFNPKTVIQFSIPHFGFISLRIYNVLGEEISTLVSEELHPGTYKANWDASSVPSGVYFYRLQAGSFTETKKLILLR
jgi:hypothetical protein